MTYKTGDKVFVEAEVFENDTGIGRVAIRLFGQNYLVPSDRIRPYTPRQEFENGEIVEVSYHGSNSWYKASYIGKNNEHDAVYLHFANPLGDDGSLGSWSCYKYCRKLKPRETITIGGVDYYKDDVEKALKDLKPVTEGK